MNIVMFETTIRQDKEGRYCLHKAAGGESKHQPAQFLRLDSTKELVQEIGTMGNPIVVINGGKGRGTYVCKEPNKRTYRGNFQSRISCFGRGKIIS